jgi:hypothetical protein
MGPVLSEFQTHFSSLMIKIYRKMNNVKFYILLLILILIEVTNVLGYGRTCYGSCNACFGCAGSGGSYDGCPPGYICGY